MILQGKVHQSELSILIWSIYNRWKSTGISRQSFKMVLLVPHVNKIRRTRRDGNAECVVSVAYNAKLIIDFYPEMFFQ